MSSDAGLMVHPACLHYRSDEGELSSDRGTEAPGQPCSCRVLELNVRLKKLWNGSEKSNGWNQPSGETLACRKDGVPSFPRYPRVPWMSWWARSREGRVPPMPFSAKQSRPERRRGFCRQAAQVNIRDLIGFLWPLTSRRTCGGGFCMNTARETFSWFCFFCSFHCLLWLLQRRVEFQLNILHSVYFFSISTFLLLLVRSGCDSSCFKTKQQSSGSTLPERLKK